MFNPTRLEDFNLDTLRAPPASPLPYTLPHLINWLECRDPNEKYEWQSHCDCLLGRYQQDVGILSQNGWSPYTHALIGFGADIVHDHLRGHTTLSAAVMNTARLGAHTMGAALERARELQQSGVAYV